MNNKNYLSIGIGVVMLIIGGVFLYIFSPINITTLFQTSSAEVGASTSTDLSLADDASPSLPPADLSVDDDNAPAQSSSIKKVPEKKSSTSKPDASSPSANNFQSSEGIAVSSSVAIIPDGSSIVAPSVPSSLSPSLCSFPSVVSSTTQKIIFNEIAWMGSSSSSNAEWMEIKNNTTDAVDLSGWTLVDGSEKIKILFSDGDTIAPGGFFLLTRTGVDLEASPFSDTKLYSGDLSNTGDTLALMDAQCVVSDYFDASSGWPGGNNTTKQTLGRDAEGNGWHTSALPGGTPGAQNSAGVPPAQYAVNIAFEGNAGGATIESDPAGLICDASCAGSFASGTNIILTPSAGPSSTFSGWSGLCYGQTICSFTITANASFSAAFHSTIPVEDTSDGLPTPDDDTDASATADMATSSISTDSTASSSNAATVDDGVSVVAPAAAGHMLISAIQIAGASSTNDFVTLYNPTTNAVDMSGWKLHKRSQTGTDYSLKVFPTGSIVSAGQSFTWANSVNGFSETIGANVSSTETLSADNSVALLDAAGNVVDAVAWGTGTGQYGEGPPYPTNPGVNQSLQRRSSNGALVDTDNNTNDFTLQ